MKLDLESYKEMSNLTGLTYMVLKMSNSERERLDKCRLCLSKANFYLMDTVHVFANKEECDHILAQVKTWLETALDEYNKLLHESGLSTKDIATPDNLDDQVVEDIPLEVSVKCILDHYKDAIFAEEDGHPIIKYHDRNYYLDSLGYSINKRPHFISLLFQDMDAKDRLDEEWDRLGVIRHGMRRD